MSRVLESAHRVACPEVWVRNQRGNQMKKTIITVICALVAPLAFGQTSSPPSTKQTTTTNPTTTTAERTTTTEGTVTTYEPHKRIVVRKEGVPEPISYVIGKTAHYVNKAGRKID